MFRICSINSCEKYLLEGDQKNIQQYFLNCQSDCSLSRIFFTFLLNSFVNFRGLSYTIDLECKTILCDCICYRCEEMKERSGHQVRGGEKLSLLRFKDGFYSGRAEDVNETHTHSRRRRNPSRRVKA